MDDIENHSNSCTKVKEEVFQAETSQYTYHSIDYKLKKLQEHTNYIEAEKLEDFIKEMHYITSLNKYIIDSISLSKIDHKSILELKKILANINVKYILF